MIIGLALIVLFPCLFWAPLAALGTVVGVTLIALGIVLAILASEPWLLLPLICVLLARLAFREWRHRRAARANELPADLMNWIRSQS